MTVTPASEATRRSVSITIAPLAMSRLATGSSPRTMSGSWARILAMATRCCSPPESVSVRCQARVEQAHVREGALRHDAVRRGEAPRQRRPPAPAADVRQAADEDVVHHGQALHEVELLVDHAHACAVGAQAPARQLGQVLLAEADAPARHHGGPRQAAEQRRLPRARPADHRDELAGRDRDRHVVERPGLAEALAHVVELDHGRDRVAHHEPDGTEPEFRDYVGSVKLS